MFRHRRNSQKPADDLYTSFKKTFPDVGPGIAISSTDSSSSTTSLSNALTEAAMDRRQFDEGENLKDQDNTPRASQEPWIFTPSGLDQGSFSFSSFVNQHQGYYLPTPGGISTLYNSQAGDLHTPGMGIHPDTSLSLSGNECKMPAESPFLHSFQPHVLHAHNFHHPMYMPQQSYAPSSFVHQDSGYDAVDADVADYADDQLPLKKEQAMLSDVTLEAAKASPTEKFRYNVTLNAPTAMTRHADEIPISYLNKGQAYTISIIDSVPAVPALLSVKYRTVIRISFEDEQQRLRPSNCWQLWKEGRGLNEAHQRGGKLQAVEYVDPTHSGNGEITCGGPELETASFDSFSVTWTHDFQSTATADWSVAVRFNFLSTDFSHSKGVKGIPVRLCAKTEIISSSTPKSPPTASSEVCFCKVKLFRDHGAERKLSNDVAHVKKTIDKLKQQIVQSEAGMRDVGKRKRGGSGLTKAQISKPGKVQKHKRTWSVSSQSSIGGRPMAEEDLHSKLATMQDMFTSTLPVSVLNLRGYEQDDPDLFPVILPGEPRDLTKVQSISRHVSWDRQDKDESTPPGSCLVSPSSSTSDHPHQRQDELYGSGKQPTYSPEQQISRDWISLAPERGNESPRDARTIQDTSVHSSVKVQKLQSNRSFPTWIDVLGVDSTYQTPPIRTFEPVACFYILPKANMHNSPHDQYRAVYLMQRTVSDLIQSVASKCQVAYSRIGHAVRVMPKGLKILIDEEVVQNLPEGQDMIVELFEISSEVSDQQDADEDTQTDLELRLIF